LAFRGGGCASVRLCGSSRLTGASFLFLFVWAGVTLGQNTSRGVHAVNTYSFIPDDAEHGQTNVILQQQQRNQQQTTAWKDLGAKRNS